MSRPKSSGLPADSQRQQTTRTIVALCMVTLAVVVSVVHQLGPLFKWNGWWITDVNLRLWEWYIEDAAISFAYARNWAMGDGLVAFPGGERIEGYSNPTWVALMSLFYFVDVDGFASSKFMGLFFGAATVVITYFLAKEIIDDDDDPWSPMFAPLVLAITPAFGFWNASGLENSLFNFMLAGGLWRTMVEARKGGFPWSAVFFLGLSVTRPEAIMYAAWAGFMGMLFAVTAGRGLRSTFVWLGVFFVPFIAYHIVRYQYFAWAFPNTYYAKLGHKEFKPFAWGARGWKYIRNFGYETGYGWFLPVHMIGLVGLRHRRAWLIAAAVPLSILLFLYPAAEITEAWTWWPKDMPEPSWWKEFRVWGLFALCFALPLSTLGDDRAKGRILCWGMAFITFFFCVRSGGDWMKGFRWMSFLTVPASVLFACGIHEIAGAVQSRLGFEGGRAWTTPGWVTATVLMVALLPGSYLHSEWFFKKRETGPFSVQKRVEYTAELADRMFLEGRIRNLDVDMGAHLYWSEHLMVDMAGLVDITVAQHNYSQRQVTKEYVFSEMKPQFAHVHGGWASTSRIPTFAEWDSGYFEVPGFPISKTTNHMGNHVRRDLLMRDRWRGAKERRIPFADGISLAGFKVPSPEISIGKALFVEVALQYRKLSDKENFRVLAFLSNDQGALHTFEIPVGYDWLYPEEWRPEEVFVGRFAPVIGKSLEEGMYDLGFVILGADGRVIPAGVTEDENGVLAPVELPERVVVGGRDGVDARVAVGEVRFADIVKIGALGVGEKSARADFDRSLSLSREDRCGDAETAWRMAWRHIPRASAWRRTNGETFADAVSNCWVRRAGEEASAFEAAALLEKARYWNHRNPELWAASDKVGAELYNLGMTAKTDGRWQEAYDAFTAALQAKPGLSWARRYAEEARDHRLKIDEESVANAKREREERLERIRAEQAERRAGQGEDKTIGPKPPSKDKAPEVKVSKEPKAPPPLALPENRAQPAKVGDAEPLQK